MFILGLLLSAVTFICIPIAFTKLSTTFFEEVVKDFKENGVMIKPLKNKDRETEIMLGIAGNSSQKKLYGDLNLKRLL